MSDKVKENLAEVKEEVKDDIKVQYGIAIVLTENKDVVVKFLEGSQKEVRLQDALGLIELAKLQLIGSVQPKKTEA
ncbi:MAG: hypothetical protein WC942_10925 [Clostridia bacterium]|jgi:hypothetical protein